MNYPTPHEINTDSRFMGVCDGLPNGVEKEATVRVYCLTAQKHNSWILTQEQLDERDRSGSFYWNAMIEAGWFEKSMNRMTFCPTNVFFGKMMEHSLILKSKFVPELQVFVVRVYKKGGRKVGLVKMVVILAMDETDAINSAKNEHEQDGWTEFDISESPQGPFKRGSILYFNTAEVDF